MYTQDDYTAVVGNIGEVNLEYLEQTQEVRILWPDKTCYAVNPKYIDKFDEVIQRLQKEKKPLTFQISTVNFLNILIVEFKNLIIDFGLLPYRPLPENNLKAIQQKHAYYLQLNGQKEIIIWAPYFTPDCQIAFQARAIKPSEKIINQASYQLLVTEIQQNKTPLSIPEDLKQYLARLNPLQTIVSQSIPNIKDIQTEQIAIACQKLSTFKNMEDLASIADFEVVQAILLKEKDKFLKANSLEKIEENQEALIKQGRLNTLFKILKKQPAINDYQELVAIYLKLTPEVLKPTEEAKTEIKTPVTKTFHLVPVPDNEDLLMSDENLLTDKHIEKVAKYFFKVSKLSPDSYTFDALVVLDKEKPHSLYNKIKNFKLSEQRFLMLAVNVNDNHWVYVFCFKGRDQSIKALYVDSISKNNCDALASQMQELSVDMQFHHLNCQDDVVNCGIWVLYFLEKTIAYLSGLEQMCRQELLTKMTQPTNINEKRQAYKNLHNQDVVIAYDAEHHDFLADIEQINAYYEEISDINTEEVSRWASRIKQQTNRNPSHLQLLQAIAYIERCYCLASGGHRLREPQKLAILNFFKTNNAGHIAQINTGEGKTTIVACIQALKVLLQGYKGHIFTSNGVLAEDGVKKNINFYKMLSITVAHNNPDDGHQNGSKPCYQSDVVYGSINNFQFDWLKHEFECQNTMGSDFNFDNCWVMLDEIDSILIDQGGNLAKLSVPFPGMSALEHVYLCIWEELLDCVKTHPSANDAYQQFISKDNESHLQAKLKALIEQGQIPLHLKNYLIIQLTKWMNSAFNAYFYYEKNVEYTIHVKDGIPDILPIDNENTGVSLHNTVLCDGLHQFLQLKHALPLSFESPTSSFVSNVGFVQKYNHKISGVTGTIGSTAEKKLLKQKFKIDFSTIPPFQEKKFQAYPGNVFNDEAFIDEIARYALSETLPGAEEYSQPRSTLIICSCIKDVDNIHHSILELAKQSGIVAPKIRLYRDEKETYSTDAPIDVGEIVIATNISGRGTDFHTSQTLEQNGGLHVIEAFLPCNQRVQDQGFGRTARQGKSGTGQILIRNSDIAHLNLPEEFEFQEILAARDKFENKRLEQIKNTKLAELDYFDRLFDCFSNLYQQLKKQHENDSFQKWHFILKDLKEKWAMWLVEHESDKQTKSNPEEAFKTFLQQANQITTEDIQFNPYYVIQQAEHYLEKSANHREPAKKQLLRLIESAGTHAFSQQQVNKEMLYQVYMLLFEIEIDDGNQAMKRFKKAIGHLFNLPTYIDNDYLLFARHHLEQAQAIIQTKILDLKGIIGEDQKKVGRIQKVLDSSSYFNHENNLGKHFHSKLSILEVNLQKIEHLIQQTHEFTSNGAILEKSHHHLSKLITQSTEASASEDIKQFGKLITQPTLVDYESMGASSAYELKPVHDVPEQVLNNAKYQIGGGLALLGLALYFSWLSPVLGPMGGAMISEGISDIVFNLFDQSEFNAEDYKKSKIISYAIVIATMGLSAIFQCTKMVQSVIDKLRQLAKRLTAAKGVFSGICQKLGSLLDKVADYLEKMLFLAQKVAKQEEMLVEINHQGRHAQFQKLQQLKKTVDLSSFQEIKQIVKGAVKDGFISPVVDLAKDKLFHPALNSLMANLKTHLKEKAYFSIQQRFIATQHGLRYYSEFSISEAIENIFNQSRWDDGEILRKIGLGIVKTHGNWKADLLNFAIESVISAVDIHDYTDNICQELQDKIRTYPTSEARLAEETYLGLLDKFSNNVTDGLFSKVVMLTQQGLLEIPRLARKGYKFIKQEKANQIESGTIEKRAQAIHNGMHEAKEAGMNCLSHGLANFFEMDEQTINQGFNLLPSEDGIHQQHFTDALKLVGKKQAIIKDLHDEPGIIREIEKKRSDRGILILLGQGDMQHAVAVKKDKDHQWRCYDANHEHPIALHQLIVQKGSLNIHQLHVIEDLNDQNMVAVQRHIKQQYIAQASLPIKKNMYENGLMFGGQKKGKAPEIDVTPKDKKTTVISIAEKDGLKQKFESYKKDKSETITKERIAIESKLKKEQDAIKSLSEKIDNPEFKSQKGKLIKEKGQLEIHIESYQKEVKQKKAIQAEIDSLSKNIKETAGIQFINTHRSLDLKGDVLDYYHADKSKLIEEVQKIKKFPSPGNSLVIQGEKNRAYRFECPNNKGACYELQLNGVKDKKTTFGVVHFDQTNNTKLDTKHFNLKLELVKMGLIESIKNFSSVELHDTTTKKTNKGLGFFTSSRTTSYDFWLDYQDNGLCHLLKLRLNQQGLDDKDFSILNPWDISKNNLEQLIDEVSIKSSKPLIFLPILVPVDSKTNHWVGVVFDKSQGLQIDFMDSENQSPDDDIQQGILKIAAAIQSTKPANFQQCLVPQQNYNNCGLELIENMLERVCGVRCEESLALEMHQELYLQELLCQNI